MSFFRDMNLARGIILLSLVGSIVLAYLGWSRRAELAELEEMNDYRVAKLVSEIQQLSIEHTRLSRELSGDQWLKVDTPELYISSCADKINLGGVDITPSKDQSVAKGVVDYRQQIKPQDSKAKFHRYDIARFLYELERQSQQVRVTDLKIQLANSRVKEDEIPEDWWTFDATITSRVREDG